MASTTRDANGRFAHKDDDSFITSRFAVVAGAATAGAALGMLAMLGRKAAVQAPTLLAGEWNEALTAEHNTVRRSLHLAQLKHALAKHALQEENVIYPALREAGEVEGADELNAEHGYVKQYLYELENMPKDSPDFLAKLADFRRDIEDHMREEEEVLFPRLHGRLSPEKNLALTKAMNKEGFKLA